MGGGADMSQMPEDQNAPKIDFDTLRARLQRNYRRYRKINCS